MDTEIFSAIGKLFHGNWGARDAPSGCWVSRPTHFEDMPEQMDLLGRRQKSKSGARAFSASDRLRDKYGDSTIFLAKTMGGTFRERVHENPVEKPNKKR